MWISFSLSILSAWGKLTTLVRATAGSGGMSVGSDGDHGFVPNSGPDNTVVRIYKVQVLRPSLVKLSATTCYYGLWLG